MICPSYLTYEKLGFQITRGSINFSIIISFLRAFSATDVGYYDLAFIIISCSSSNRCHSITITPSTNIFTQHLPMPTWSFSNVLISY